MPFTTYLKLEKEMALFLTCAMILNLKEKILQLIYCLQHCRILRLEIPLIFLPATFPQIKAWNYAFNFWGKFPT